MYIQMAGAWNKYVNAVLIEWNIMYARGIEDNYWAPELDIKPSSRSATWSSLETSKDVFT